MTVAQDLDEHKTPKERETGYTFITLRRDFEPLTYTDLHSFHELGLKRITSTDELSSDNESLNDRIRWKVTR